MVRRGYNSGDTSIPVYEDEIRDHKDYLYYREMSRHSGLPLSISRRSKTKPPNAHVVRKSALQDVQVYQEMQARAKREGKILWVLEEGEEE